MRVRAFNKTDYRSLCLWLALQKHPPIRPDQLPEMGWVVPGVGMAFLRRCEGDICIMDSLVTNPHVSAATRNVALNTLFAEIKFQALELGYTRILGFTVDAGTLARAQSHGYKQLQHAVLSFSQRL